MTLGRFSQALASYSGALILSESLLGTDRLMSATIFHNIAVVHDQRGDLADALRQYAKALKIRERALGEGDPLTALTCHNIACIWRCQGKVAEALKMHSRVLRVRKQGLGESLDTAESLEHVGLCNDWLGYTGSAVKYLRLAVEMRERLGAPCDDLRALVQGIDAARRGTSPVVKSKRAPARTPQVWGYKWAPH